jgi:hypothetical protein
MDRSGLTAVGAVLIILCACHSAEQPTGLAACVSPVTVTVESAVAPRFSWSPSCRLSRVIVDPNSDVVDSWVLATAGDTNGLRSPIDYGSSPNGSETILAAFVLQSGAPCRVRVLRATGDTTMPFEIIGTADFTP